MRWQYPFPLHLARVGQLVRLFVECVPVEFPLMPSRFARPRLSVWIFLLNRLALRLAFLRWRRWFVVGFGAG